MIVFVKKLQVTNYILKYVNSNRCLEREIKFIKTAFEKVRREMVLSTSSKEDFTFNCIVK